MRSLVLTLGHNSSAILVEDGNIICAYEEERLSGVKSDSTFPLLAIQRINDLYNLQKDIPICVGHWFLDGDLPKDDLKHWRPQFISSWFPDSKILSITPEFSHHDSHMLSAEVFAGKDFQQDHHTLVVDGFGTSGECISVYKVSEGLPTLIHRVFGFHRSIGLFYQYATAYCGMKMHQDEWKMLGYETHINEVADSPVSYQSIGLISYFLNSYADKTEFDLADLATVKDELNRVLDMVFKNVLDPYKKKVYVSFVTQRYAEMRLLELINQFRPTNLLVTGGCFLNVKLNSMLADMIPGKFCAMPLAGDQGAGLGVYQHYFNDLKWPDHLFWGDRDPLYDRIEGLVIGDIDRIKKELSIQGMVNVVRGKMEFGPRALCHTSTLAIPTLYNVDLINKMNGRDTVMPMALVVTENQAIKLFEETDKIHKSLEYMIITRKFKPWKHEGLEGGAHYYPTTNEWTCRPQVTKDPMLIELLEEVGPLINTSFNVHGTPIVWNQQQIEYSTRKEREICPITTLLMED